MWDLAELLVLYHWHEELHKLKVAYLSVINIGSNMTGTVHVRGTVWSMLQVLAYHYPKRSL